MNKPTYNLELPAVQSTMCFMRWKRSTEGVSWIAMTCFLFGTICFNTMVAVKASRAV